VLHIGRQYFCNKGPESALSQRGWDEIKKPAKTAGFSVLLPAIVIIMAPPIRTVIIIPRSPIIIPWAPMVVVAATPAVITAAPVNFRYTGLRRLRSLADLRNNAGINCTSTCWCAGCHCKGPHAHHSQRKHRLFHSILLVSLLDCLISLRLVEITWNIITQNNILTASLKTR
jgi:hypothetical protein